MIYCSFCYRQLQTTGLCPYCGFDRDDKDDIKVYPHNELAKPCEMSEIDLNIEDKIRK